MSSPLKFHFKAEPGERIEAVLSPAAETRSVLCGVVRREGGAAIADAVAILFDSAEHIPLAHAITDEDGMFCFGPLVGDKLYDVAVFSGGEPVRALEFRL